MAIAATTLAWMLHAWRTPGTLERTSFDADGGHPEHSFSLIVPARRGRRPVGRAAHELRLELVLGAERARVLLLVPQPPPLPRGAALHPARRQHRLHPHRPAAERWRLGPGLPRRGLRARREAERA